MWHRCAFAICITVVTGSIADRALAQGCDDRFPWTCRSFGGAPEPSYRPAPYPPPRDPYYQRQPYPQADPYAPRYPYRPYDPYQQRDVYQPRETSPYPPPAPPAA